MLPPLNDSGELPPGIHPTDWAELRQRFGTGVDTRVRALGKLQLLHQMAERTGKLVRFLIFGSFVSATPEPRDVDVILVMAADFKLEEASRECQTLFSHADADARYGASIFWLREGMLPASLEEEFFDTWQTKRDGAKRGIVEVKA
jgi:hypothetical protein